MGQKLRKMVMKRKGLCDLVVGATRVQGPGVGRRLGGFLEPALRAGEELPDLGLAIRLYGRRLQGFCDAMVGADARYLKQRAALADLFRDSEEAAARLKASVLSLRSTCEGLLGRESLRALGLDFNVAQELPGVLRQGEIIRDRLLAKEGELTPERWVKEPLTREEVAAELDEEINRARAASRRLVAQRKVVDTAKVRKDQAIEEFDRRFIPIVRALEASFRVAGETELADRIRPTVRQLGRDDGQEDESAPEAAGPEAPAESGDAAAAEAASPAS